LQRAGAFPQKSTKSCTGYSPVEKVNTMANLISVKRLPSKGNVGDVYFDNTSKLFYLALANGTLFALDSLLGLQPVPAVGPRGEQGPVGAVGPQGTPGINGADGADSTVAGPQGPAGAKGSNGQPGAAGKDGADGRNGKDGKDSTVAGPQGPQGIAGPAGPRGDVLIPTESELAAAVIELRQQRAKIQAALLLAISESKTTSPVVRAHLQRHLTQIKDAAGF
jgi:hypothetical protein